MADGTWIPEYAEPIAALAAVTVGFIIYHFSGFSGALERKTNGLNRGSLILALIRRGTAVLLYGIIPLGIVLVFFPAPAREFGITVRSSIAAVPWIAGLVAAAAVLAMFTSKNEVNLKSYPQIRERDWNTGMIAVNVLTWTAYLAAYEFLFRGFLLFSWYRVFGFWPAVAVNLAVYTLVHLPKGFSETIGSLFVGLLFCLLTLESGTILIAFCVHVGMALSNEIWSLIRHPEMKLVRRSAS